MKIGAFSILAAVLLLAGCSKMEDKVVGTWTSGQTKVTIAKEKTYTASQGFSIGGQSLTLSQTGSWKIDGNDLVITPETLNGKPIEEVKSKMMALPTYQMPAGKTFIDDLDKPGYYNLSSDGKTLEVDKARDQNANPAATFTKSETP